MNKENSQTYYLDENLNRHYIKEKISQGGQGVVYRTDDINIAIKLEIDSKTGEPIDFNEERNKSFDKLRLLPINNDVNITIPLATLKDKIGYVMILLNDMESFEKAFKNKEKLKCENDWIENLSENFPEIAKIFSDYIVTGGAKRRYIAYYKVACYLAKLHSAGLVYCDISENNLFISENKENNNVWLIDADNINFQKYISKKGYFTNGYGAPEVVKGLGSSFYSDSYAFMISMFWQVSMTHPFVGAMTEEDDEDDFDDEDFFDGVSGKEQKAYNGEFPWVLDKEDTRNNGDTVIPAEYVFSKKMMKLLDDTFSYNGKNNLYSRPSMYQIAHQLDNEVNEIIQCDCCEMEYNFFENRECPYCDSVAESVFVAKTYACNSKVKSVGDKVIKKFAMNVSEKGNSNIFNIPLSLITNNPITHIDEIAFEVSVEIKNQQSEIECLVSKKYDFDNILNVETNKKIYGKFQIDKNKFSFIVKYKSLDIVIEFEVIQ